MRYFTIAISIIALSNIISAEENNVTAKRGDKMAAKHSKGADRFSYPTDPKSRLAREKPHPVGMDRYCIYLILISHRRF